MGALATWGAVAGAANAVGENKKLEQTRETDNIDEARAARILKLKAKYSVEAQGREQDFAAGEGEKTRNQASELQTSRLEAGSRESELNRQEKAVRGMQDRESSEKIAGMKTAASSSKGKKRWTPKTIKGGSEISNGVIKENPDTVAITDENTGQTYTQQGRRFIPQGTPPENIRDAPRRAVADLIEKPERADQFVEAYGYLPAEFF